MRAALFPAASALGFGCASLGSRVGAREGRTALDAALDAGITWFDLAPSYGDGAAETIFAAFVRGKRERVQICTKCGIAPGNVGMVQRLVRPLARAAVRAAPHLRQVVALGRQAAVKMPVTAAMVRESLDRSLRRLGTDRVEVYALHDPAPEDIAREDVRRALEDVVATGKARIAGVAGSLDAALAVHRTQAPIHFVQLADPPFDGKLGTLRAAMKPDWPGLVSTHSVLGQSSAAEQLAARLGSAQRVRALLEAHDYAMPEEAAARTALLDLALARNRDGIVLVSMLSSGHVTHNAASLTAQSKARGDRLLATLYPRDANPSARFSSPVVRQRAPHDGRGEMRRTDLGSLVPAGVLGTESPGLAAVLQSDHPSAQHEQALSASRPGTGVLACIGWPRGEATGPVRSLIELASAVSGEFGFKVLARERKFALGADNSATRAWERYQSLERYWCEMSWYGPRGFASLLRTTPHDILMLNSFFDREMTLPALTLRRLGRVPRRPTVVSVRGEFADGSLGLKSGKKRVFIEAARRSWLFADVWLHATGPREAEDVARVFPWSRGVLVAPNVRLLPPLPVRPARTPGVTRLAFLGRIARVKNLDYALDVLARVTTPIALDIFGPVGEPDHWQECQRRIAALPAHVSVSTKGEIANEQVVATLAGYDALFLPTRGENFGHAILEALAAGVPVLISDQTPWQDLERHGAGWSLPLAEPAAFTAAIARLAALPDSERERLGRGARGFVEAKVGADQAIARNREMLVRLLAGGGVS